MPALHAVICLFERCGDHRRRRRVDGSVSGGNPLPPEKSRYRRRTVGGKEEGEESEERKEEITVGKLFGLGTQCLPPWGTFSLVLLRAFASTGQR